MLAGISHLEDDAHLGIKRLHTLRERLHVTIRDVAERSEPQNVIRTLAYQLGMLDNRIGASIAKVLEETPSIAQSPLQYQFFKLLIEPLSSLLAESGHGYNRLIVLVLDALDECGTPEECSSLLAILAEESAHLPPSLRILIMS